MKTKTVSKIARVSQGVAGGMLVLLGIAFWTGHALTLIPLHAAIGLLFILSLWVLVFLALKTNIGRGFAAFVVLWSIIVPVFGVTQMILLPGGWHWVIQVAHLLIGIIAMNLGAIIDKRISLTVIS